MTNGSNLRSTSTYLIWIISSFGFCLLIPNDRSAEANQQSPLPPFLSLDFRCPTYVVSGSCPITLHADILGTENTEAMNRLTFRWKLSEGNLLSGQGTKKIVLDRYSVNNGVRDVKIDLEVENGPPEMAPRKSCSLRVNPNCSLAPMIDQYSSIPIDTERQHLDRLAQHLKEAPLQSVAYIMSYAGQNACIYEAAWRANRARQYLLERHNIPSERVIVVESGFRESWTIELFIQPANSCGPLPSPSLMRAQARVKGQCHD